MAHFFFFLWTSVVVVGAWAQPAISRDTAPARTALELQRAELRLALKAPHGRETPDKGQTLGNSTLSRHLSAQERADLRQQLRQQRRD